MESNVQALPGKWAVPPAVLALVAPDVGMERVARRERVLVPFLFALFCSLVWSFLRQVQASLPIGTLLAR